MFDALRKRISNAISSMTKEEQKEEKSGIKQEVQNSGSADETVSETVTKHEEDVDAKAPVEVSIVHEEGGKLPDAKPKQEDNLKLSISTKLKGVFSREISLKQSEIDNFTEQLMYTMLQSDVSYSTTEKFIESLKKSMEEERFDSRNIKKGVSDCVRKGLFDILKNGTPKEQLADMVLSRINSGMKPLVILFLGPNGTGKTTTMAKVAFMFKGIGISSVFSASDTFRAAAIEQTAFHAAKLGIPVIKGSYGADPASIAFDAVQYAKAHSIDVVLIDTAGRQETNKNLLSEINKMERVAKPDITIYIGESTAGNRIAEQIAAFVKYVKIDGIILTKLDCDAKGGNAISISDVTGLPVFFFGTGESYDSLVPFDSKFVIDAIVPN